MDCSEAERTTAMSRVSGDLVVRDSQRRGGGGNGADWSLGTTATVRIGRWGLLVVAFWFCTPGCSNTPAAAPASPLGAAKASIVVGLPVPSGAALVVNKPNELGEYRLPRDVGLAALNEWFNHHLPPNDWKDWVRCHLDDVHDQGLGKLWSWKLNGSLLDLGTISIPGTGSMPGQVRVTERIQKLSPLVCT